jgi:hypothetical protein
MRAEHIAIRMFLRELVPIKGDLEEICNHLRIERSDNDNVTRVLEDNEGALKLANSPLPRTTPQSKHFAIKYHWFPETLKNEKIEVLPISTTEQVAEIFTKGMTKITFAKTRLLLLSW